MGMMVEPDAMPIDCQWIALSDHAGPIGSAGLAELIQVGSLVLELAPPKDNRAVLLDHRSDQGWPRALSIFCDARAGIVILHRQGARLLRYSLRGPLPRDWKLARLTYSWDGPSRFWSLRLEDTAGAWALDATGRDPMPLFGDDIAAVCEGSASVYKDPSVHWFGVCLSPPVMPSASWLGHRTPLNTARGRVMAGDLRLGDRIATRDNGYQILRSLRKMMLPNRGRFSPVLLRAPYFARQTDLLVAPEQLTLISGAAVEYLFGEDAVLAPAAALRDGNSALPDTRRPTTACIALDLGAPEVIFADGCPLLCGPDGDRVALPYRLLQDYEALTLQSALGRGGQRAA